MPGVLHYDPDDREVAEAGKAERAAIEKRWERNWKYYVGQHDKHLLDDKDNIVLNLCRQAIDRMVAFLAPDFPRMELAGGDVLKTDDEKWLDGVWQASGGAVLLMNMAVNGALNGQVYGRVIENGDAPLVVNLKPTMVVTFWNADDYRDVLWHELKWKQGKNEWRQDVVNDGTRWLIRDFVKRVQSAKWELSSELVWPYTMGPIVTWQHLPVPNAFLGQDELQQAGLNDMVNKVASDISRILRFHAYPRTIGTGFEAEKVQATGIDDFWTVPDPQAKVFNLEMQSDLAASVNFLNILTDTFFSEARVVQRPGGLDAFKGVTNLGIRMTYLDMIAKNETLRRNYGNGLIDLSKRLQMVAGKEIIGPSLEWGDPLPVDDKEEIVNVQSQLNLGLMSPQTASGRLGLDYESEQRNREDALLDAAGLDGFVVE